MADDTKTMLPTFPKYGYDNAVAVDLAATNLGEMSVPARLVEKARQIFNTGRTKDLRFRKFQLKSLLKCLEDNSEVFERALYEDLHKPKLESVVLEINYLKNDLIGVLDELDGWTKPEKPPKPIVNITDGVYIYREPYGVVLVMGAWNYPLQLTLAPVIGAIAAGNCVIIKPSEGAPATATAIANLLSKYLDPDCYPVYLGGIPETTILLEERFDYIFYTGSTVVGKIVHKAANKYLTPVTLELGGKSPAYIDETADIAKTTRRILWGKLTNSGQTCIAPDYILCTKQVEALFIEEAKKALKEFYGDDIQQSLDFSRIINDRHFERLSRLLGNLNIAVGGHSVAKDKYIEPTIATGVCAEDPIMQEEIFGPILPIVSIENIDQAIRFINRREKPLALYIFSRLKWVRDRFLEDTSSGGVCVNDTMLHVAVETLPFGGVGYSGMGAYHGWYSYDTFSHKRSVLVKGFVGLEERALSNRYPPYTKGKLNFMIRSLKKRPTISFQFLSQIFMFLLGVLGTVVVYYLARLF